MSSFLWSVVFAMIIVSGIATAELSEQCEQHGKNIGKPMAWNVFAGCEEVRK